MNEKAAVAESNRLDHIQKTNLAITNAQEEVRKMEEKVAEYLALFKQLETETNTFV